MSVKSSFRNLISNEDDSILDYVINKDFDSLEDFLKQEIQQIDKLSPNKLKLNDNDLDNLEKLIDLFISPYDDNQNYQHAMNFLNKYN